MPPATPDDQDPATPGPGPRGPAERGQEVLTVSQFNRKVQALIEGRVPLAWIEGEISNLAAPASGHLYFTLKDNDSQVRAAMFRTRSRFVSLKPRNGLLVRVQARATLYLPRGDYQLIVEHMEEAGIGALQRAFEQLKAKLSAEGLFAPERKREIPRFPRAVGVVTSSAGAAIHDILTVLRRRAPWIDVVVYPTLVQGREAAAQIADAIETANARAECDVLIVGRGGGSLEDLWPFNEEIVARAIADSEIPVISAVGHETDFSIADFVADLRAPTPSAAAERVAPDRAALHTQAENALRTMTRRLDAVLREAAGRLALARKSLVRPDHKLREYRQTLDELELRAGRALRARLAEQQQALESAAARLNTVSPLATLARGYAIVRDAQGAVLKNAVDVPVGAAVNARLANGSLACRVEAVITDDAGGKNQPG